MRRVIRSLGSVIFAAWVFLLLNPAAAQETVASNSRRFRIAIFKEALFPSVNIPVQLTPEWIYKNLADKFSVTYLDAAQLGDQRYLDPEVFDLLILPYGEAFPAEAFPQIRSYLTHGGGLLSVSGIPFWSPMNKVNGSWEKLGTASPYEEFLAPLGIKYYEFADEQGIGLTVTTSLSQRPVEPTRGNVFPYRIPARDFDQSRPFLFVKTWRNPYLQTAPQPLNKWCLVEAGEKQHPLDPQNPAAAEKLLQIVKYLSFPLVLYDLDPDCAAYYPEEQAGFSLQVINTGRLRAGAILEFTLLDQEGRTVYTNTRALNLSPGKKLMIRYKRRLRKPQGTFYFLKAVLRQDGMIMDKTENGFVVIDRLALEKGPSLRVENRSFIFNGKKSFVMGTNYYESRLGELIWVKPNLARIRKDFQAMRALGINLVRIHYHHSKWFRDYFSQVVKTGLDPYFAVTDRTALPSERSWRILDAIVQLAQEEGLVFCPDLFSLVPVEMGDPIGWLGLRERITDRNKVEAQKAFLKLLAQRYRDVPGITWDLWNEPRLEKNDRELLRGWSGELREVFRQNGDRHYVTIGDEASLALLDVLDYACIHTYTPGDFIGMPKPEKPVIFQEVWEPAGCGWKAEAAQAEELRKDFADFLQSGASGFMPWQWTRQARLWNNASDPEQWDDELGACVRDDGTLKPAGRDYGRLIQENSVHRLK